MKFSLLIVNACLLFAFSAQASDAPTGLCSLPESCTDVQKGLWEKFESSTTPPALVSKDRVYQGGCYMISPSYSPDIKHYGYIYLRQEAQGLGFHGKFSFFATPNPFANLIAAEAAQIHSEESKFQVAANDDHWAIEIDSKSPWRYALRQSAARQIILVGQWGPSQVILCEMKENL